MKKLMRIIWKAILVHFRINTVIWAFIGLGTFLFNSQNADESCEIGDPDKGIVLTIRMASSGLRKSGKLIWLIIKETASCIADEIGSF